MKFGFVTCVQLGVACIEEIYSVGGKLDLVITLNDDLAINKSGRVYVDDLCRDKSVDLVKIRHVNDPESIEAIRARDIDWLFIIGWSQIAGPDVLGAPKRGVLGIHPTLLPVGRGRAPIPWAILHGLTQTGVTLFMLDSGVDTGDIIAQEIITLEPNETATTLYDKVNQAHQTIIRNVWNHLVADTITLERQDEAKATVWPGRTPDDGRITADMTVEEVERLVRATTRPYPGAFFDYANRKVRIWSGRIADETSDESGPQPRINLRNGVYEAIEYELE